MNWDDAKYFLAVARAGQMLSAARRLGVNQATLSRRIAALEEDLGLVLFERHQTGCTLTTEARTLLPRVERIEAEFLGAQTDLTGLSGGISGTVRLGVPDGFGLGYLLPRLPAFMDAHPDITLQLVPVPRVFSLSQREADIAVMVGRPERGRLKARKLTDYSLGLYAAQSYLDKHGTPMTAEDLATARLVGFVDDLIPSPDLNYAAEVFGRHLPRLEVASSTGQIEAVKAGCGVGVLHDFMAAETDLVRIIPSVHMTRTYWMAWHQTQDTVPVLRAVIDFLVEDVAKVRSRFLPDDSSLN